MLQKTTCLVRRILLRHGATGLSESSQLHFLPWVEQRKIKAKDPQPEDDSTSELNVIEISFLLWARLTCKANKSM